MRNIRKFAILLSFILMFNAVMSLYALDVKAEEFEGSDEIYIDEPSDSEIEEDIVEIEEKEEIEEIEAGAFLEADEKEYSETMADIVPEKLNNVFVVGEQIDIKKLFNTSSAINKYSIAPKGVARLSKKTGILTIKKASENVIITAFCKEGKKTNPVASVQFKTIKPAFIKKTPILNTPGQSISMNSLWLSVPEVLPSSWEVSCDSGVATIDNYGYLTVTDTLRKSSKVKVMAYFGEGSKKAVYKANIKISLPKLNKSKVKMKIKKGKTFKLSVKNTQSTNIRYISNNSNIVKVDEYTGVLTPVSIGTTSVQCFVDNVPYSCMVTVK